MFLGNTNDICLMILISNRIHDIVNELSQPFGEPYRVSLIIHLRVDGKQ